MENFTSNINKPDLHNYNTDDFNFMEDEYVSDFSSVDNNNEGLDDIIFEEDIFEDSNIGLNSEEYSDTSNFFQLDMNALHSARHFSTILNDNIDESILELDSNFNDDESVITMANCSPTI